MRHRLLNHYEEVTYDSLTSVCESNGARVFPKVRLADVFAIEKSKLSSAHFGYCLRSHFDFLVTDKDYQPQFSVEFDGPLHRSSAVQRHRDLLKNDLCAHFAHGLLRINSKYLTPDYRGLDLLTYFVDAWFLERAFDEAQRSGAVPYDEPFDMTFIYHWRLKRKEVAVLAHARHSDRNAKAAHRRTYRSNGALSLRGDG